MPIYEYRCNNCEHRLEILQKISDTPTLTCPECGKEALVKLVSAAAFKLKGTGWYETDFKDKKPAKESKTTSANNSEGKKSTDSDTKKSENSSKEPAKTSTASSKSTASSPGSE